MCFSVSRTYFQSYVSHYQPHIRGCDLIPHTLPLISFRDLLEKQEVAAQFE